jgi:hypothetical protein
MANKYMKKCSTYLVIKVKLIKNTLRFHLAPVKMAIIKKTNNKCWQEWGEAGKETSHSVGGDVN